MKLLSKNLFDRLFESSSRFSAQRVSRRSVLSVIGKLVVASTALPLLPVYRKAQAADVRSRFAKTAQTKDPTKCNYWRYCRATATCAPVAAEVQVPARRAPRRRPRPG